MKFNFKKTGVAQLAALAVCGGLVTSSHAAGGMSLRASFADAALSIDAWGSHSTSSGFLQTDIAAGSTVLAAYLYSANVWGGGVAGDVTLNGTFLSSASGTALSTSNPTLTNVYDVTSFMKVAIESSAGGLQSWSIAESGFTDGEVLVVAYTNASTVGGTAIILDGGLPTGGRPPTWVLQPPTPAEMRSCPWRVGPVMVMASTRRSMSPPAQHLHGT